MSSPVADASIACDVRWSLAVTAAKTTLAETSQVEAHAASELDRSPTISLIVAVDHIHPGLRRSLESMLEIVRDDRVEVLAASRHPWPDAPAAVSVIAYDAASRGDRFDQAALRARGEVLAFVDDRVRLDCGWASRVTEVFADPDVRVAGGPILPRSWTRAERVGALIMSRRFGITPGARMSRVGPPRRVNELAGSNLLIRAHDFHAVGGFQSPSVGGEAVRLCYKVRALLGQAILHHPSLAVRATAHRFPGPLLSDIAGYGRARGDLARRFREVAPLIPYGLPTLATIFLGGELALLPLHRFKAVLIGLAVLIVGTLAESLPALISRSRLSDRLIATAAMPLVPLAYGLAFIRGYLGPSLGEISPPRASERPLRVLIMNWRDVAHPWSGGAEAYMHEMGRRWTEQGIDVGWLSSRYKKSRRVEVIDGIRIHRVGGAFTLYPLAAAAYLRLRRRYDVIVDCENGIPFFTPLFSRLPRIMVVHHVHRDTFHRALRPPLRWLALFLEGRVVPLVYRRTRVVAVSASTRDGLIAGGFDPAQISVVHNGVLPVLETGPTQAASAPALLCMGRLKAHKSVDVVIGAMPAVLRAFPEARLDIVGQGPDRSRLERLAWSLRLANHVRFHGYLPAHLRDQLAAQAWVAVCP